VSRATDAVAARRRAAARAHAQRIASAPRVPRQFTLQPEAALRGSPRRRVSAPRPRSLGRPAAVASRRGRGAVALVVAELGVLVALLVLPAFHATGIDVRGARLLSRGRLLQAAGIRDGQSIFTVDGEQVRQRLERLPWVRQAVVETELPATVRITVTEWDPVLELRRGSTSLLVAAQGATVDRRAVVAAALPAVPVLIDERPAAGADPPTLDGALVRMLPAVAAGFPGAVGCAVADFRWQADGRLLIESACRWVAVIGHVDTPAEIAAVPDQVAALAALRGRLDFAHPNFGYVDLEDPSAPAVGGRPGAALAGAAPAATAAAPARAAGRPPPAGAPGPPGIAAAPPSGAAPSHGAAPGQPALPASGAGPSPQPTPYSFTVGPPPRR
jgi:POTRA domain, FtsQ-type